MKWLQLFNYGSVVRLRGSHISSAILGTSEQSLKPVLGISHTMGGFATPQRLCCRQGCFQSHSFQTKTQLVAFSVS